MGLKVTGGEIGTKSCISDSSPIQHEILENILPHISNMMQCACFLLHIFLTMSKIIFCRFLGNKTDIVFYIACL